VSLHHLDRQEAGLARFAITLDWSIDWVRPSCLPLRCRQSTAIELLLGVSAQRWWVDALGALLSIPIVAVLRFGSRARSFKGWINRSR